MLDRVLKNTLLARDRDVPPGQATQPAPRSGTTLVAAPSPPGRPRTRARGKSQVKVLPSPGTLSTRKWAPWRLNACLTMASPSPVPPRARERPASTRKKR